MRRLLRVFFIFIAVVNLGIFLVGLGVGIMQSDLLMISGILTVLGFVGMVLSAIAWFIQSSKAKKYMKQREQIPEEITRDTTEAVMKNIRGIPFLIQNISVLQDLYFLVLFQAIQYSMETSYYRNIMNDLGDGIVRTSVIHTAPACQSILDSESNPETSMHTPTPRPSRNSAEEQWLAHGEKWRNEQLRLSMERENPHFLVFPYSEASPHRESMNNMDALVHEFSRLDSIKRPHCFTKQQKIAHNHFQVRCIGMSAEFIERFNNSFGANTNYS
ncbi:hypothetical protein B9Z55_022421 [Caenorhabditis nigoni]|uniref:Uncharacterized protein n=1 Tax=Caenorhabditis nigoni TaxID=1611254 RepID=A0A2G5SKT2_9PELO|nr:hypothetical protein B9Z55_022421 [Caenorhabditis nigoni]